MTPIPPQLVPAETVDPRALSLSRLPTVVVIGAGVAGLTCASRLAAERFSVTVLDKGRRPGGRVSTRRDGGWAFDHGAQYFTAQHPAFERQLETWLVKGAVAVWDGRIRVLSEGRATGPATGRSRYVGVPGMSTLARWLAGSLQVETGVRADRLVRRRGRWCALDEQGEEIGRWDLAVAAVPAPQAARLLGAAPDLAARAASVTMLPTWAVMLGFERRLELAFDAAFVHGSPVSWAASNGSKPGRKVDEAWVLHGGHDWSHRHLEEPPEAIGEKLLEAFRDAVGKDLPPASFRAAHRWRYAVPEVPFHERFLLDEGSGVGACGDWCGGPRVEGAFLSGRALARRIAETWGGVGWTGSTAGG